VPAGNLLAETVHSTEHGAYIEILTWQSRIRLGEVMRAELIDLRRDLPPGASLTNLRIRADTRIEWSWLKADSKKVT
jgi:hypothetical protein